MSGHASKIYVDLRLMHAQINKTIIALHRMVNDDYNGIFIFYVRSLFYENDPNPFLSFEDFTTWKNEPFLAK